MYVGTTKIGYGRKEKGVLVDVGFEFAYIGRDREIFYMKRVPHTNSVAKQQIHFV